MSQRTPPNPGRRRFFGKLVSSLGREAGLLAKEARRAAREVDEALRESGATQPPTETQTPIHTELDEDELAERLDAIDAELAELEGQVARLVEAAAQPHPLAEDDRALLRRVAEALAERHTELAETPSEVASAEDEAEDGERAMLRRRRAALREGVWKLITALLGVRLFDALYETFVSDELVPWAKEQWRGIFARAEAAGVIEESPLPSPTAESPHPPATSTPATETPTPPQPPSTGSSRSSRRGRIPVPEMVPVGAGYFWMGSDKRVDRDAYDNELPQHRLYIPAYRIGKYPVTVEEYAAFLVATGHRQPSGWEKKMSKLDHPVTGVFWDDAVAYCRWLSDATGDNYRLSSEAEWEKAARGNDGRIWPWGNQPPNAQRCNFDRNVGGTAAVGSYPAGVSPYGCYDMAGNVYEWTSSLWEKYPYRADDGRELQIEDGNRRRVLRGGGYGCNGRWVRCAYRIGYLAGGRNLDDGFRLASGLSR